MLMLAARGPYLRGWVLTVFCWISTGTPPACPVLERGTACYVRRQSEGEMPSQEP